jgi:hypothetical protein
MKKTLVTSLICLVSGTTAFTSTNPSTIKSSSSLSSSRYNDDYYRDYSNYNSYNNRNNYDNYVIDRNAGRFDNSVGSASYGSSSYGYGGGGGGRGWNTRRNGYGSSREYRTYDSYNSNDYYRGGGSVIGDYYNRPYDRIGSSENFRLTSSLPNNSRRMRNNNYYYDDLYDYDIYNNNYYPNNYVQQRRGGYADDIGGRSRYSTPMYSNGGYASPQGLSEDFRTGREGPMSSMTSRRRQIRNNRNYSNNRIQDYYTPGERELMSQRDNNGLRYGWQQQYNRGRGNVRMGSGEDFRRGSALTRISDYFTPLERERRQMSDNRALGRGGRRSEGYYDGGRDYYGSSSRGGGRGMDGRRGGYYEDYPDYGFGDYYDDDEYDDYFENDGGYSSGSRRRGRRNGNTWDNLLNMFRS